MVVKFTLMIVTMIFLSLVVCGIISALITKSRWGFFLGFFLSVFGVVTACFITLDSESKTEESQKTVDSGEKHTTRLRPDNGSSFPPADNFPPRSEFP